MSTAPRYRTPNACNDKFPIGDAPYWRAFAAQAAQALAAGEVTLDALLFTTFYRGWERAQGSENGSEYEQDAALQVRIVPYSTGMRQARYERLLRYSENARQSGFRDTTFAELVEWERSVKELRRTYRLKGE